jgi:hypothetical protein
MTVKLKLTTPETPVRDEPWQIQKDGEHFFVTSAMHWNKGTDLLKALKRQIKVDGDRVSLVYVWKVPCPVSEDYAIEYYRPQVDGAVLMTVIEY